MLAGGGNDPEIRCGVILSPLPYSMGYPSQVCLVLPSAQRMLGSTTPAEEDDPIDRAIE